jgi:hypothetical protein
MYLAAPTAEAPGNLYLLLDSTDLDNIQSCACWGYSANSTPPKMRIRTKLLKSNFDLAFVISLLPLLLVQPVSAAHQVATKLMF